MLLKIRSENMGIKVVSGDISLVSQSQEVLMKLMMKIEDDQGASISYKMPNGMTVGAFTFKSD